MHNVFIFGAGTSVDAGAPTMRSFIDTAAKVRYTGERIDRDAFEDVFSAIAELYPVFAKSSVDLDNIESLLGAIDMGQLLARFAQREVDAIDRLKQSIRTVIVETLENSMRFPVENSRISAHRYMQTFAHALYGLQAKRAQPPETAAILTFNYDMLTDVAFASVPYPFWYHLDGTNPAGSLPLLKLHGSLNWTWCAQCQQVAVRQVHNLLGADGVTGEASFRASLARGQHESCLLPMNALPLLVPPTWDKAQYQTTIGNVWKRAAQELSKAERIFIVGYSLPETDSFFRYLFALGTAGTARLEEITIYDPDVESIRERYDALIGKGVRSRVSYAKGTFRNFVDEFVGRFDLAEGLRSKGFALMGGRVPRI